MPTTVTVAIPTHNRAVTLRDTLRSVFILAIPPDTRAECLLVDNGSTDETARVFDEETRSAPFPARRVFEARPGESLARNRAIDECRGDFLLFIDDDAVADRLWAANLVAAMEGRGLDAACGMVLPRWATPPPSWLGPRVYPKLAVHDRAAIEAAPHAAVEKLANYFGANMGFRCSALDRFGRFREDLGVVGASAISGADTDFFVRLQAQGARIGFAADAMVHHQVGAERMTREYLLKKSFAYGFGSAIAGRPSHNGPGKLIKNFFRMGNATLRLDHEGAMYHQIECANFFGYWCGRVAGLGARRTAS